MCCVTQYSSGCHYPFGSPPPARRMTHRYVSVCFPKQCDAQRGHRVIKNIVSYCISILFYVTGHGPCSGYSNYLSLQAPLSLKSLTASLCLLCLRPQLRACLPRIARSFLSNPLHRLQSEACSSDISHKKQSRCSRRWSACRVPRLSHPVQQRAHTSSALVPDSFPASSPPYLASPTPCPPVFSVR